MDKFPIYVYLVCLSILWTVGAYYYLGFAPRKCSGDEFWDRLLNTRAFLLVEGVDHLEIAWPGIHGVDYYIVRRRDAEMAYAPAVKRHVEWLIAAMEVEVEKFGKAGDYWSGDLSIMTGQNFGTNSGEWRKWWSESRTSYEPPPGLYQKLDRLTIDRELGRGHPSPLNLRNRVASTYPRHRFWSRALLASLVPPTVIALLLCVSTLFAEGHLTSPVGNSVLPVPSGGKG